MNSIEWLLLFLIILSGMVLMGVIAWKFKPKKFKKQKGFIVKSNPLISTLKKFMISIKEKEGVDSVNVLHLSENGHIYLVEGFISDANIVYNAETNHKKQLDYAERSFIHLNNDKNIQECFLCDTFSASNFKVNPSIEKKAKHLYDEYTNAYNRLEKDFVRKSIINMSKDQMRVIILFFVAGAGISSLIWGGALVILLM